MIRVYETKEEIDKYLEALDKRGQVDDGKYLDTVKEILANVKANKDQAVLDYTIKFDNPTATLDNLVVSKEELKAAWDNTPSDMKLVIKESHDRVWQYHMHQKRETWIVEDRPGEKLGQKFTPLNKIGVYVPGGKAAYPSSVIMNVVPAKVAGVKEIIMLTPAKNGEVNPLVLAAAYICEVDKVIKVGGAQAIAALAYGTNIIPKVDKIVGPGNIFVTLAKKSVFGMVGIDSVAGPSEILILADDEANPEFLAYDLMAQAEHDELASSTLITTSKRIAEETMKLVNDYACSALRSKILETSLTYYSGIILVDTMDEAIELSNTIAPEHLEVCTNEPFQYLDKIINAGAIFLGNYTPEALGDYMAGPSHVLPTVKTARFFSPLNVDDFVKKSSIINFTKAALDRLNDDTVKFAFSEGLEMHGMSVKVRK